MNNLKKIREEKGLSQNQLAKLSGVNQNMISRYESGQHQMNESSMIRLIQALNTNADYFLGLIDDEKSRKLNK